MICIWGKFFVCTLSIPPARDAIELVVDDDAALNDWRFICLTVEVIGVMPLPIVVCCWPPIARGTIEAPAGDFVFVTTTLVYLGICCVKPVRDIILGHGFIVLRLMKTTLLGLLPPNCWDCKIVPGLLMTYVPPADVRFGVVVVVRGVLASLMIF